MPTLTQPIHQDAASDRKWGRIVVGVDDSSGGVAALRWAVGLARSQEVGLVAVRAWALGLPQHGGRRHQRDPHHLVVLTFRGGERREAAADLVRRTFGVATGGVPRDLDIRIETPEGDPGAVLASLAANPGDLVVVGTQRGHILKRLLHGSVSRYCSRHTSCPVVVVGPDEQPGAGDWQ
jgi:nucleotide-binding universal stress UspA family protein